MNSYTVELTNGIELIVSADNPTEAIETAKEHAAQDGCEVTGAEPILLDCSISF